jgi:predicted DNA-binding protein
VKRNQKIQKSENKFLSVVLPLDLFIRLSEAAKTSDRSKSKYVELLIRRHLDLIQEANAVQ